MMPSTTKGRGAKGARRNAKVLELARADPRQDKPLPYDEGAELRLVGALVRDPRLAEQIPPSRDFYHPIYALIVGAVRSLLERGDPVTPDKIIDEADRDRPEILTKHINTRLGFWKILEEHGETAVIGRDAETVRACATLRRQLEMLENTCLDIRERGAEDPRGVLELNRVTLREADSVTTDARRAILRGSDVELGRALLELLRRGGERLVHDLGAFWRYDPMRGIWRRLHSSEVEQAVQTLDGLAYGDGEILSLGQNKIRGAMACAAAQVARPGWFSGGEEDSSPPPAGLCFENGFVRVTSDGIELVPHSPNNRCTAALPFAFDLSERCDRWIRFLGEVFNIDDDGGDKARMIQEFIGAALLGIAPRYARAVLMLGGGRNGKGVAMDVLMSIFPKGSVAAIPPQQLDDLYARAQLAPLLLNAVSEMPSSEILASEPVKAAIAGDLMNGRNPAEKPFFFRARAGHLYAANKLPSTVDHSVGFFERFTIISFNRFFKVEEREPGLAEHIIAHERPGLAAWALIGAVELLRRKHYQVPGSSERALDKWRDAADQIRQFVDERCLRSDDEWIQSSELYREYRAWGERNGHRLVNSNTFAERLEQQGLVKVSRSAGSFWPLQLLKGGGM